MIHLQSYTCRYTYIHKQRFAHILSLSLPIRQVRRLSQQLLSAFQYLEAGQSLASAGRGFEGFGSLPSVDDAARSSSHEMWRSIPAGPHSACGMLGACVVTSWIRVCVARQLARG